ncbi:MAG: class I SAM-dependent methyltransferase [Dehalococcoidia bacterium]|nr:class I SAM-dependent methyltransferase [Dehalococcoidia bacterium]
MQEDIRAWEGMADWWDGKMGDGGDLWHRALIDPTVIRLLGTVRGEKVLDIACGNGYLSRKLSRLGARVTGVDASTAVIDIAAEREAAKPLGITYYAGDAARLDMLGDESFTIALCNMGLMNISDAEAAIQEVWRVLKNKGRFIASLSHPCFDPVNASAWVVEKSVFSTTVWRKISRYREIYDDWVPWRIGDDQVWTTRAYHRPLSWYFRALKQAGFVVTALEEPEPTDEFLEKDDQAQWIAQIPVQCVIEARKLAI